MDPRFRQARMRFLERLGLDELLQRIPRATIRAFPEPLRLHPAAGPTDVMGSRLGHQRSVRATPAACGFAHPTNQRIATDQPHRYTAHHPCGSAPMAWLTSLIADNAQLVTSII